MFILTCIIVFSENSQTRQLSLSAAIDGVLQQYEALKFYFGSESYDGASGVAEIHTSLYDSVTKLYVEFLQIALPVARKIHLYRSKLSSAYRLLIKFLYKIELFKSYCFNKDTMQKSYALCFIDELYLGSKVATVLLPNRLDQFALQTFCLKCMFYVEAGDQI